MMQVIEQLFNYVVVQRSWNILTKYACHVTSDIFLMPRFFVNNKKKCKINLSRR